MGIPAPLLHLMHGVQFGHAACIFGVYMPLAQSQPQRQRTASHHGLPQPRQAKRIISRDRFTQGLQAFVRLLDRYNTNATPQRRVKPLGFGVDSVVSPW